MLYPEGYENPTTYTISNEKPERAVPISSEQVVVPETYHVSAYHAPVTPKDADSSWVSSQSAQAYTIEIANSDKASRVANVLMKAPKNERTAEVKYQRGRQEIYKGFYGSYPSYEAAQQALSALPEDIKQGAGIQTWGSVQSNMSN